MAQNARMSSAVMEDQDIVAALMRQATSLPTFDRLVLMLRWAEGFTRQEAALALDAFAESAIAVPVPRKRVSSSPRDAFLHLLATALLYNSVVATGAVLYVLLDRWLPLPGERAARPAPTSASGSDAAG